MTRELLFMLAVLVTTAVYAGDKTNAPAIESFYIRGKVVQVLDDGILIKGSRSTSEDRQLILPLIEKTKVMRKTIDAMPDDDKNLQRVQELVSLTQSTSELIEKAEHKGTYFVTGITDNLADGENWRGTVYYVDLYQYISVSGAKKTVRRYSTSQNERNVQ